MIEGIDYYPKKNKSKVNLKFWILFLFLIVVIAYWYVNNNEIVKKQRPTLIIISEPNKDLERKIIPLEVNLEKYTVQNPDNFEQLDEVIQTYNRENK